ncbi:unnamed protein product [Plasmodium vivax]|uniref:(malaria parasite P. vivax) hypothetical protein n=1 Tax=Plasmodium vivax TaxID=5855 RepID=A0A8S4H5K7_PLAVI|nr:unnamed protein product [Plasmodium vivax]
MASNRSNPQYFTYQEYNEVKKSFVYIPDSKFNISFVNDIIKRIHNTPTKEGRLYDTFYQLKKFISRSHSFVTYGKDTSCNYINYWLNKTVRDSEYGINEGNFKFFDESMQLDPKVQETSIDCISKLSYMNKDAFEKTKKLYDLYDYFTKLKENEYPSSLCKNISALTQKYESVLQECNGTDNLWDKLTNLKSVIVKDMLSAKNICTNNTVDSFISRIDTPRKEQTAVTAHANVRKSVEKPPPPPVSRYSSQAHGRLTGETHTTPPISVTLSRSQGLETQALEKQAREVSERTLSVSPEQSPLPLSLSLPVPVPLLGQLEPLGSSETEEPIGPMGPIGPIELEPELDPEPELRPGLLQEQSQEQRHLGTLKYPYSFSGDERYIFPEEGDPSADSKLSTFNTETIMETIKGAVSNVLEAVEPVPVLGVSGGMGALYLLFKYTPIGSIFRRNKRNNQYIPNFFGPRYGEQFSGYYPEYYNEDFQNYRMNIAYHPSSDALD